MRSSPVVISIQSPAQFDRVQLLVRLVLAIALGFLGFTAGWIGCALYLILPAIAAGFISSRGPDAYLVNVAPTLSRVLDWLVGFQAYMLMAVDRPAEPEQFRMRIAANGHPSLAAALLRLVTSLPAALLLAILLLPAGLFALIGVVTVLVSRSQPESLLRFQRAVIRYAGQLAAYHADLVDDYPSLHFDSPGPGAIDLAARAS